MNRFAISLLLLSSLCSAPLLSWASSETLFRCKSEVPFFDPNFEQGDEIYLDVTYDLQKKWVAVKHLPSLGKPNLLFLGEDMSVFLPQLEESSFFVRWNRGSKSAYMNLVYLGQQRWGMAIKASFPLAQLHPELRVGSEIEILCKETPWLSKLFENNN